jgi:DNA-binding transcriptional LysR family regulator
MLGLMIELSLLRQFVAVAETEHVGRAAQALHISASPLSRRVQQLEAELGLALFTREKKRLRLTAAGRELLDEARGLLAKARRLEASARDLGAGVRGTLRLGFVEGAVHAGVLPEALSALRRAAPGLRVELESLRSSRQLGALLKGELDAGFLYGPTADSRLRARRVVDEPLVLVVAEASALGRRRWLPKELEAEPFIALPEHASPSARAALLAACARVGFVPDVRCEVAEPSAVLRLVAAGVGIAIVQASLAKSPGVRAVRLPPGFALRVQVLYATPTSPSPLASRLESTLAGLGARRRAGPTEGR